MGQNMLQNIILLTHVKSQIQNQLFEVLNDIGFSVFRLNYEEGKQRFDEVLDHAQAVLVVLELEQDVQNAAFDIGIRFVLEHHRKNTKLAIIPIIEESVDVPAQLLSFPSITFKKSISPTTHRLVVERLLQLFRESDVKSPAGMEELMVEAQLQIPRLKMVIDEPRTLETIGLVLGLITTLAGVALSIPQVLARLSLAPQWLFIGPILFIAGGLLTIYLYANRRRERRRMAIATMLHNELKDVVDEIKRSREKQKRFKPQTDNGVIPWYNSYSNPTPMNEPGNFGSPRCFVRSVS
ncbi:MAG TPA: hypothetical protein VGD61_00400 [Pyrinomonadaceae bacterium]